MWAMGLPVVSECIDQIGRNIGAEVFVVPLVHFSIPYLVNQKEIEVVDPGHFASLCNQANDIVVVGHKRSNQVVLELLGLKFGGDVGVGGDDRINLTLM